MLGWFTTVCSAGLQQRFHTPFGWLGKEGKKAALVVVHGPMVANT
jgi:hypothetical protein